MMPIIQSRLLLAHLSTRSATPSACRGFRAPVCPFGVRSFWTSSSHGGSTRPKGRPVKVVVHPTVLHLNDPEVQTKIYFVDSPWPSADEGMHQLPVISRELNLPTNFPRRATLHPQHCNGLWLLYSKTEYDEDLDNYYNHTRKPWFSSLEIVIVSPTTGDIERLPRTRRVFGRLLDKPGFGYVSRTKEYKVASITNASSIEHKAEVGVEVYTLGQGATEWRLLRPPLNSKEGLLFYGSPLLLGEAIHWHFCSGDGFGILRLDLETETFKVLPAPQWERYTLRPVHLVEIDGRLGLLVLDREKWELEIWVWKNGVPCKYRKNIDIMGLIPRQPREPSWRALSIGNGEILVSSETHLYLLNVEDGSFKAVSAATHQIGLDFGANKKGMTVSMPCPLARHDNTKDVLSGLKMGFKNEDDDDKEEEEEEEEDLDEEDDDDFWWMYRGYPDARPLDFSTYQDT